MPTILGDAAARPGRPIAIMDAVRSLGSAFPLLYLVVLACASAAVAASLWASVQGYRSEYALDRHFDAGPALADGLLIVILDGLRSDRAADLPSFGSLAERGASGEMRVTAPSLSNPARAALVTGASPEVSGVTNNGRFDAPPVQSLLGMARRAGMETFVLGTRFWPRAFRAHISAFRPLPGKPPVGGPADLAGWQASACEEALASIREAPAALQVVGLVAGDEAGHYWGGRSHGYRQVTSAADDCLGRLVAAAGPGTAVLALSDHGHIHRWGKGGHGGTEPEVLSAPFAMAGPGIRVSRPSEARILDVAPTASMLLGLPIPANSQGRVLWDALDVPADLAPGLRELERVQRDALLRHLPDTAEAAEAARRRRVPLSLAACAWFLAVAAWAVHRQPLAAFAGGVAAFAAAYYGLFYLFQLGYSISSVVRQEFLYSFFGRDIAAAALATPAATAWARRASPGGGDHGTRLAALVTSLLALSVVATYYAHGLRMQGWMIEIDPAFRACLDLLAIVGAVLGALVLGAVGAFRGRREARQP